jgi:hypothetical protein
VPFGKTSPGYPHSSKAAKRASRAAMQKAATPVAVDGVVAKRIAVAAQKAAA